MKFLDGEKFFYKIASGLKEIIKRKDHLNKINYFPVADGDTGTNLALTSNYIIKNTKINDSVSNVAKSLANAAFNGARGNSGIILAQFFKGISNSFENKKKIDVAEYSIAIKNAVEFAYNSVNEPVEGTILTVMKEWSLSLNKVRYEVKDFKQLFAESFKAAKKAMDNTINQLKILKKHNVVDAGAKGFVFFLEGVKEFLKSPDKINIVDDALYQELEDEHEYNSLENIDYRYCCQLILTNPTLTKKQIINTIGNLGDSLIIAEGENKFKIHIHSNKPNIISTRLNEFGNIANPVIEDMISQYNLRNMHKKRIAIVTDSTCDLPSEYIEKNNIYMNPLMVNFDGSEFIDKVSIKPGELYNYFKKSDGFPKTSQPNINSFVSLYRKLFKKYDRIISIHISKNLSGTYESAIKAANIVDSSRVYVADSKNLSTALGLLIQKVSELVNNGVDFEKIVEKIEKYKENINIYVSVKNLKYMIRGGRVSKAKGLFAKILNLKPIISLDKKGKSTMMGKSFSFKGNLNKITNLIEKKLKENKNLKYAIGHVHARKEAEELKNKVYKKIGKNPQYITDVSPIIGTHAGIGSLSISIIYD
ncbi:MAG: DegV family EDD domain-containing protein [Candidatus Mcinerneyibacterium aminivorans]|uniref:DegV family EDD domain-containing protein n=1 Tax=Candidatus Mcinerneyibacterium aminivorans TaxID=2703815 RepID=A0A5D0MFM5_9BACT|nr:MAG: DegV family EDD domain-containing protein [Candidatus Mcinerneyibacterium aminivorans]